MHAVLLLSLPNHHFPKLERLSVVYRHIEAFQHLVGGAQNKMHINDWAAIQLLFEKLNKQLEKTMKSVGGINSSCNSTPRPYLRLLVEIQDFVAKSWEDKAAKKKMSPTNARAMTTMRQRLKKHNASFHTELEVFREHSESSSEDEGQGVIYLSISISFVWVSPTCACSLRDV